ncbi:MAG: LysR family transcriptional regulator [Cellvibrionaceae bacterium]
MSRINLARVDLKLLSTLQVLLEERNVTRAAERLFVSQPAMSKSLQKLKSIFNDPLFERTAHGLIPTPKAQELAIKLPELLAQFHQLIDGDTFTPNSYQGQFKLALPQVISELSLPPLVKRITQEAPLSRLLATDMPADYLDQLATGKLDFVVHRANPRHDDILSYGLGQGNARCLMRKDHPLANKAQLSIDDYLNYPHLQVYFPGMTDDNTGIIDQVLRDMTLARRIVFSTTHLGAALESLLSTDCLLVGPDSITRTGPYQDLIHAMPFPPELPFPQLEFVLLQHRRTENSLPHLWLRDILLEHATISY